jgi:glycosyltransferase involved in cell wall biosynthesis
MDWAQPYGVASVKTPGRREDTQIESIYDLLQAADIAALQGHAKTHDACGNAGKRPILRNTKMGVFQADFTKTMTAFQATVVITTKNRCNELRTALASVIAQRGCKIETIVIDDGSDDDTAEMVRANFPNVRLVRHEKSAGYIVRRNEAAQLAHAPVIVSIDDDATFASPDTVTQTLAEFDFPLVGAVAIPFINVNRNATVWQQAPDDGEMYEIFAYIGTAHAVRRNLFLDIGGYREFFFHQGEEMDVCIRLMDAGYIVKAGRADPIHHFESPKRIHSRMMIFGRRNDILFSMLNVPAMDLPVHLAGTSFKGLAAGIRLGHPWWAAQGLLRGYAAALTRLGLRRPVRREIYKRFRRLKRHQMLAVHPRFAGRPKKANRDS